MLLTVFVLAMTVVRHAKKDQVLVHRARAAAGSSRTTFEEDRPLDLRAADATLSGSGSGLERQSSSSSSTTSHKSDTLSSILNGEAAFELVSV